ncbi:MAG: hypothetical protein ACFFD4_38095 [Candidatus Odinarchaeota archaeon]
MRIIEFVLQLNKKTREMLRSRHVPAFFLFIFSFVILTASSMDVAGVSTRKDDFDPLAVIDLDNGESSASFRLLVTPNFEHNVLFKLKTEFNSVSVERLVINLSLDDQEYSEVFTTESDGILLHTFSGMQEFAIVLDDTGYFAFKSSSDRYGSTLKMPVTIQVVSLGYSGSVIIHDCDLDTFDSQPVGEGNVLLRTSCSTFFFGNLSSDSSARIEVIFSVFGRFELFKRYLLDFQDSIISRDLIDKYSTVTTVRQGDFTLAITNGNSQQDRPVNIEIVPRIANRSLLIEREFLLSSGASVFQVSIDTTVRASLITDLYSSKISNSRKFVPDAFWVSALFSLAPSTGVAVHRSGLASLVMNKIKGGA